jgi:hypothetical protein
VGWKERKSSKKKKKKKKKGRTGKKGGREGRNASRGSGMLPPLHNGSPRAAGGYYGGYGQGGYGQGGRGGGGDSRLSDYGSSRASSRASSVYSVDREVWSINRTPAPPSEASFAFGGSRASNRSLPSPPNRLILEQQQQQQQQQQRKPMPPPYPMGSLHRTGAEPAPFRQRYASAARARRLDERRDKWLERKRVAEQQREIEELEFQLHLQEKEMLWAREQQMQEKETIRRVRAVDAGKYEKQRKAQPLLQLIANRHLAAGNQKEFARLAGAIGAAGGRGYGRGGGGGELSKQHVFGKQKRGMSGMRQNRVRRNPSSRASSSAESVRSFR